MDSSFEIGGEAAVDGVGIGTALQREARPRRAPAERYQRLAEEHRGTGSESLSDLLGLFSIGLGLAQVAAPGAVSKLIGIEDDTKSRTLMRLMGVREIGHGLGILSQQHPEKWVWSRVAGDALDLALLGRVMANPENHRGRTLLAAANVLAVATLDVIAARQLSSQPETAKSELAREGIIHTRKSVTIRKPVEEVFAFWSDFTKLPRFMTHLESVQLLGDGRTRWRASAPAGKSVEWEAITTGWRENEMISWESTGDSDVYNAGAVHFNPAPGGRGTEVRIEISYDPPFGKLGSKVAMLFREEPGQQVQDDLRRFKQILETGEIVVASEDQR
jgi:uncharacterized membrane protein